ncbi:MAG TPA: hypothetical protein VFQ02_09370 [Nitrospira sp.]|nr:hypothetical protein [Nitrospira sp.]
MLLILTFFSVSVIATPSDAATIFGGSRIIAIDQGQQTITFKTKEGQTWTLPVMDPKLLKQPKDEQVTIEIDLNDRIINVVQLSGEARNAPRTETEDR